MRVSEVSAVQDITALPCRSATDFTGTAAEMAAGMAILAAPAVVAGAAAAAEAGAGAARQASVASVG